MENVIVKPTLNGPYEVQGNVTLTDHTGKVFTKKEKFYLCRCGGSSNKPYCDGTHKKIGFKDACEAR